MGSKKLWYYVPLLLLVLVFSLISCDIRTNYIYLHDTSQISSIEIVIAYYDEDTNIGTQETILVIENRDKFIEELEKMDCHFSVFGGPVGITDKGLAVKIAYNNGDYEVFRHCGRSEYTLENGYNAYSDRGNFRKNDFLKMISNYLGYEVTEY